MRGDEWRGRDLAIVPKNNKKDLGGLGGGESLVSALYRTEPMGSLGGRI